MELYCVVFSGVNPNSNKLINNYQPWRKKISCFPQEWLYLFLAKLNYNCSFAVGGIALQSQILVLWPPRAGPGGLGRLMGERVEGESFTHQTLFPNTSFSVWRRTVPVLIVKLGKCGRCSDERFEYRRVTRTCWHTPFNSSTLLNLLGAWVRNNIESVYWYSSFSRFRRIYLVN